MTFDEKPFWSSPHEATIASPFLATPLIAVTLSPFATSTLQASENETKYLQIVAKVAAWADANSNSGNGDNSPVTIFK